MKIISVLVYACFAFGFQMASAKNSKVEILRDGFGTPHVYAEDNYGVYFGYGYVVAEDRLYQMEILRRTVEGQVAEVLGEKYLSLDIHIRSSYDHRAISKQLSQLSKTDREILIAYAEGFNHRIDEVMADKENLMPKEFVDNGFEPKHWSDYDVAMLFAGAIAHRYSDFNSELDNLGLLRSLESLQGKKKAWRIFNGSKWLLDRQSPTTVPRTAEALDLSLTKPSYLDALPLTATTDRVAVNIHGAFQGISSDSDIAQQFNATIAQNGYGFSPEFSPASNFWAVGKSRADGAQGILLNGPQFGWGLPSYVYGIGLHGGDFDVVGNTLLALPALLFAHNNSIAWGSTAGLSDQVDVYVERLKADNKEQYLHQGQYKNFEHWQEIIQVKGQASVSVTARRSVHGMVQQYLPEQNLAYSRARAWEGGELATLMAWVNLAKVKDLDAAQKKLAAVSTNINFYYMDIQGNIAYTHGGRYPIRAPGHDSRLPVDGSGAWDWRGYMRYEKNPTVRNPKQGYIANWNNRPAQNWGASDLWPYTWSRGDRTSLLQDRLAGAARLNKDQIWNICREVSFADVSLPFLIDYLTEAWQGKKKNRQQARALELLEQWDQQWSPNRSGKFPPAAAITAQWLGQLLNLVIKDDVGAENFALYRATNTPNLPLGASMGTGVGIKAIIENLDALKAGRKPNYDFFNGQPWQPVLVSSLVLAVAELEQQQGVEIEHWGLQALPMKWQPFNFRGVPQAANDEQQISSYMNRGSENNLFIATGEGFIAFDVIPPGQSGFIAPSGQLARHYADQLDKFREFKLKPIPYTREAMEALAPTKKTLSLP